MNYKIRLLKGTSVVDKYHQRLNRHLLEIQTVYDDLGKQPNGTINICVISKRNKISYKERL